MKKDAFRSCVWNCQRHARHVLYGSTDLQILICSHLGCWTVLKACFLLLNSWTRAINESCPVSLRGQIKVYFSADCAAPRIYEFNAPVFQTSPSVHLVVPWGFISSYSQHLCPIKSHGLIHLKNKLLNSSKANIWSQQFWVLSFY